MIQRDALKDFFQLQQSYAAATRRVTESRAEMDRVDQLLSGPRQDRLQSAPDLARKAHRKALFTPMIAAVAVAYPFFQSFVRDMKPHNNFTWLGVTLGFGLGLPMASATFGAIVLSPRWADHDIVRALRAQKATAFGVFSAAVAEQRQLAASLPDMSLPSPPASAVLEVNSDTIVANGVRVPRVTRTGG